VRAAHPQGVGHIPGDAREPQRRGAALFPEDLYVFPGDPARPPDAQGFQGRLLRREAGRKVLIGTSFRLAVGPLSGREDAAVEPVAVPLAGLGHPLDFQQVGPDPQDHHVSSPPSLGRAALGPKTPGPKTRCEIIGRFRFDRKVTFHSLDSTGEAHKFGVKVSHARTSER
jgi:hypothetical protein